MEQLTVKKDREFWIYMLLNLITFGIYSIFFMWSVVKDLNMVCYHADREQEENSPNYILVLLFSILTFGLYGFYWMYKLANRMKRAGDYYGVRIDEDGKTYLLYILVSNVVAMSAIDQMPAFLQFIPFLNSIIISIIFLISSGFFLFIFIKNINKLCNSYSRGDLPKHKQAIPSAPMEEGAGQTQALAGGIIEGISGTYAGVKINIKNGEAILIGRDGNVSNLVLEDSGISRKHCDVRFEPSERMYYVTDYSSNGVFLNDGKQISPNVREKIKPGTRIRLGKTNQVFLLK